MHEMVGTKTNMELGLGHTCRPRLDPDMNIKPDNKVGRAWTGFRLCHSGIWQLSLWTDDVKVIVFTYWAHWAFGMVDPSMSLEPGLINKQQQKRWCLKWLNSNPKDYKQPPYKI